MSSPNASASPTARDSPTRAESSGVSNGDEKPRLTEKQKKENHIASEQKRRQAIREGFDQLTVLVPGIEGLGRSEGTVLQRTVEHMRLQVAERKRLIEQIEALGGKVDESLRYFDPPGDEERF